MSSTFLINTHIDSIPAECWATVYNAGPTFSRHRVNNGMFSLPTSRSVKTKCLSTYKSISLLGVFEERVPQSIVIMCVWGGGGGELGRVNNGLTRRSR